MANTFLDAVTNTDVFTASNNDVKLVDDSSCKFAWLKSSLCWESKETRPRLTLLANFTTYLPREIPGDITFISSILKLVQRCRISWIKSIRSSLSRKEIQTYSNIQPIPPSMNFSSNIERLPRISHRKVCNFPMSKANDFTRLRSRACARYEMQVTLRKVYTRYKMQVTLRRSNEMLIINISPLCLYETFCPRFTR